MCASCKDPGLSGYPTWYFHHVDTYCWDRGPRADKDMDGYKTSWDRLQLRPRLQPRP